MISVDVVVKNYSRQVADQVRAGAKVGVLAATEEVRNEVLRLILNTPKTGRISKRRGVTHQASAPGEPPASDTGRLVGSIRTEYDAEGLQGTVVASTNYAFKLEFGTPRIAARPFMRPALANTRGAVNDLIERAVRAAILGGTP